MKDKALVRRCATCGIVSASNWNPEPADELRLKMVGSVVEYVDKSLGSIEIGVCDCNKPEKLYERIARLEKELADLKQRISQSL